MRFFNQWKAKMRQNTYDRKRQMLAHNFVFARPIFSEKYKQFINKMNDINDLKFNEI